MRISIGRKFQLYVTGIIIVGAILVFIVVRNVIKQQYTYHFTQEIETAQLVLDNYLQSRFALLKSGIDIMLSDPRFMAAIAEGDPTTAQHEVANFRSLVQADIFVIADTAGKVFAEDNSVTISDHDQLELNVNKYEHAHKEQYRFLGGNIYQTLTTPLSFGQQYQMGKLLVGYQINLELLRRLKSLTGSDILLLAKDEIISATDPALMQQREVLDFVVSNSDKRASTVQTISIGGEDHLLSNYRLGGVSGLSMIQVRSLDDQLDPAIANISLYLILLTIGASIVSLVLIYRFTSTKLTGAVNRLVEAAGKISSGQLDNPIQPLNNDELGYLASCFDNMRQTLLTNRETIARVQEERINAERLATIGQLAAGIIHDFKSPMTAIALSVEAIIHGLGGEAKRESYCRGIKSQVQRMANMTQDLLDYAHGNKSLNLEALLFVQTITQQVEFHRERFDKQRIGLVVNDHPEFVASIDPHKFRRVVDNLLNNAFEALSPGNNVSVTIERNSAGIHIGVNDDGPGIPEEIIKDIFKPFVTHGKSTGTGLGLAISHKVISDHGGELSVTSTSGNGAHFLIRLPVSLINEQAPAGSILQGVST
ncbi:MAG: HAMP domain-containing histidine kinase [bacterium]|nr:HAMP domain-containing histidine kinase [bacterium]